MPAGISLSVFSFRGKKGDYQDIRKDKSIDELKKGEYYSNCVNYIDKMLSGEKGYYKLLLERIETIIKGESFDISEQSELYYCIREAICELVNAGISKTHIYTMTQNKLFSEVTPEEDIEYVMDFLQSLTPKEREYQVVFGVTEETYKELNSIIPMLRKASSSEVKRLKTKHVVSITLKDYDPVSALENAEELFLVLLNVYNSFVHSEDISVVKSGLVKSKEEKNFKKINSPSSLMKRNKKKPKKERIDLLKNVLGAIRLDSIASSFELHNIAVTSENPETQLLMLWTIFELLVETSQDTMSKVNYITNAVSAVLCLNYYRHILETLYSQITTTKTIKSIIIQESRGKNEIEKMAFVLKDNTTLQKDILSQLSEHPLESYKIVYYASILSIPKKIKDDLYRHSKRIRWQMMRIYRNRCMIVHDGSHLPYINNIIENLHFYVDDLFEYMIDCFGRGLINPEAILADARIKEKWTIDTLSKNVKDISDEEYISIVC